MPAALSRSCNRAAPVSAAGKIAALTGAACFRIETVKTYPEGYKEMTEAAMQEL